MLSRLVKRWVCAGVAAGLLVGAGAASAQAETVFHLYGFGGSKNSYTFTEDGITLTVTATAKDRNQMTNAKVNQNLLGLGVYTGHGDSTDIDGSGKKDYLWLEFSKPVKLDWAKFSGVSFLGGEDARFVDENGNTLGNLDLGHGDVLLGLNVLDLDGLNLVGTKFGLTVKDKYDEFRLKKLAVSAVGTAVPLPQAAWAGLALLGVAGLRRRRGEAA